MRRALKLRYLRKCAPHLDKRPDLGLFPPAVPGLDSWNSKVRSTAFPWGVLNPDMLILLTARHGYETGLIDLEYPLPCSPANLAAGVGPDCER